LILREKVGVADLCRSGFEIFGGFVILRQTTKQCFQIALPRHLGQTPKMVCAFATVGDVDHTCETVRSG
jgi:hypothetical protein